MKKLLTCLLISSALSQSANSQTFNVQTIQYSGDPNSFINIVILGDGYTSSQQTQFVTDATNLSNYLFSQPPYSNYKNFFNVYAIKVISAQSGAKHPYSNCNGVPYSNPNTYLGCSFDSYGIHRLIVPTKTTNIANVLGTNFPNYDQVIVIANSPYYGGSGGSYATSTIHPSSPEIVVHEVGHSFGNLADEYYAGDMYNSEKANMTQQTNSSLVKWKNWIGVNGVGIKQHCCGEYSSYWYKPHSNCKMQYLGSPYCSVCKEALVEKIHSMTNPIVQYTPTNLNITSSSQTLSFKMTKLMKPIPNTLKSKWTLDGTIIYTNLDSIMINSNSLSTGNHILKVSITDETPLVRKTNHSTLHVNSVTWNINKTNYGIALSSTEDEISCSVYPNPSSDRIMLEVESETESTVSIQLLNTEGKVMEEVNNEQLRDGKYNHSLSIAHLPNASYLIVYTIGKASYTQTFIKE